MRVRGNATMLHRLAANLIDNAQRHGAPPVELNVAGDAARGEAVLTVSDAGAGIADAERLRRPFERGDAARSSQGAGLGLAIVDGIAARHGGQVEIARNARAARASPCAGRWPDAGAGGRVSDSRARRRQRASNRPFSTGLHPLLLQG